MASAVPAGPIGQAAARPAAVPSAPSSGASRTRRSLRTELLFSLAFLTSAAVILAGLTTVLVASLDPGATVPALVVLWIASTLVFVLFGQHLVRRVVLRPLAALSAQADRLAAGETTSPPPALETRELAHLASWFPPCIGSLFPADRALSSHTSPEKNRGTLGASLATSM